MSKAKMLFDLILYVNAKRNFTAQDVANEFGISVRTAHRYLTDLAEMGVPLYTEPGRGGGYRILNNRLLPPVIFDEHEAFAIFFAFQSLKYVRTLPFDINISSVSRNLYAGLPDDTKRKVDRLDSVMSFWNQKRSVPSPHLEEMIEAAAENRVLVMEYVSRSENTIREIVPLGVYAYKGFWYMPAFEPVSGEIRQFRTDRIVSVEQTQTIVEPPMNLTDWLNRLTAQDPKAPVRLYAELTREGLRQCRSQPWLEPHIVTIDSERGYVDAVIDRSEFEFVSDYFFQLGTAAKVIEPGEMADRIGRKARELSVHYGRE
ncbi:helix-turn-helix transcriptional regulator [Paenibacillus sp. GYB003]|uniref:helix-turn-helix transcriptional regulator n=1 Tax=Paenibacillus sp. GYB003 TaxID=2994392 RepID=UPI002F961A89